MCYLLVRDSGSCPVTSSSPASCPHCALPAWQWGGVGQTGSRGVAFSRKKPDRVQTAADSGAGQEIKVREGVCVGPEGFSWGQS